MRNITPRERATDPVPIDGVDQIVDAIDQDMEAMSVRFDLGVQSRAGRGIGIGV
jgi:hypothetical protein